MIRPRRRTWLRPLAMLLLLLAACAPVPPPPAPPATPAAAAPPPTVAPLPTAPAPTAALTAAPTPPPAAPTATPVTPRPALADAVREAAARHPGTIGVVVTHLETGESASLNAETRFRTASLYKLFILLAAAEQLESGALDPDEVLTLTPALAQANPYADLPTGARTTAGCALRTMVEMSGNAAADLLETRLGLAAINARIRALGLRQSELTANSAHTSPGDVARLLEAVARGQAGGPAASARILDLLLAQQHVDLFPAPLPLGIRVANKTGQLPGLRHDAGIVYAPSGAYLFVAMVQDAPTDADARTTIHDLSRAAYTALEPTGLATYRGLPPRLAREVFRLPDEQGRLELLADPRTEAVPLNRTGLAFQPDADEDRLRPEALPDLVALQAAAAAAGQPFTVAAAYRRPADADAARTLPPAWHSPCPVEFPPGAGRAAAPTATAAEPAPPEARQRWLGTVVRVTDTPADAPSGPVESDSAVGRWLLAHAWGHGFVPALPESAAGVALGHEPWTLRWVGRDLAADLRPAIGTPAYGERATQALRRAQEELAAHGPAPNASGLRAAAQAPGCWTDPSASTRGCPARWYFLPLP